jgi:hypothetical protein
MSNDAVEQQVATSDDVLWGAKAIAAFVGLSLSEVQYFRACEQAEAAGKGAVS